MEKTVINNKISKIFKKQSKLEVKHEKLQKKFDKLGKKMYEVAYQLDREFFKNNLESLNTNEIYYRIYIDNSFIMVEELYFQKKYSSLIEFRHKSEARRNMVVNAYIDIDKQDYESNGAVIDKKQLDALKAVFKVIIRK